MVSTNIPKAHWQAKARFVGIDVGSPEQHKNRQERIIPGSLPVVGSKGGTPSSETVSVNLQKTNNEYRFNPFAIADTPMLRR